MARATEDREPAARPGRVSQWMGLFLAPVAFFAHLQTNYLLVPWTCTGDGSFFLLHLVSALAMAVSLAGVWSAWHARAAAGSQDGEAGGPPARARVLGNIGLTVSAFMVLALLAQWVTQLVVPACQ